MMPLTEDITSFGRLPRRWRGSFMLGGPGSCDPVCSDMWSVITAGDVIYCDLSRLVGDVALFIQQWRRYRLIDPVPRDGVLCIYI